jgi:hypothetical protein
MSDQITAEFIDMVESVRLELLSCKTRAEIEAVFSKAKIENFAAKTEFLHRAMQMTVYGHKDGSVPNDQDVYEYYLKIYLDEEWKDYV